MELKPITKVLQQLETTSINRTFMELKHPSTKVTTNIGNVLIEPLWN